MSVRIVLLLGAITATTSAGAKEGCERLTAPGKFEVVTVKESKSGRLLNAGIRAKGFVDLKSPVVHGIDVSKYQDHANFPRAYECGARFAYIRLSAGEDLDNELQYRVHWANARVAQLVPGPYHTLSIIPDLIQAMRKGGSTGIDSFIASNAGRAEAAARKQAENFLLRLDELKRLDPTSGQREVSGRLPIALALSADPLPDGNASSKSAFAPLYQRMACAWIGVIRGGGAGTEPILLFTTAEIYKSYHLDQSQCELPRLPVWISHRPATGDRFDANPSDPAAVNALCRRPSGEGKCIFEQYTSFGGFAAFASNSPLDLNRFLGSPEKFQEWVLK